MSRPDFTLTWAGSRLSIPAISAGNYAAGWDTYLGPLPPLGDDHDYVMNLQDRRAVWLGDQMLKAVGHDWQDDVTYDAYAVVRSPVNGQLYRSLVGANSNNEPSVSGAQWALGVASESLNTTRIDVPSAATVNLTAAAPNTRNIRITGSVAITGFTVATGQTYLVTFSGATTLTNNAAIVTNRGANITAAAGDTCIIRSTAENVVEVICGNFLSERSVGVGQAWQDLSASRSSDTVFTNTSGRPIAISIYASQSVGGASRGIVVTVAGLVVARLDRASANGADDGTVAAIIPPGATYSVSIAGYVLASSVFWLELR